MTVAFLHTADVHVATFTRLLDELSPGHLSTHVVDESLLSDARERGGVDNELSGRMIARLREAAHGAAVVVCTCSTISGPAESLAAEVGVPIIRVDRPMAEQAVSVGSHIAVIAALESTLGPTVGLINEVADQMDAAPTVELVVVPGAWSLFEAADQAGYSRSIAASVDSLDPTIDVVVLAQASMASAAELCTTSALVLSSPRPAVAAAVALT
jgi:hypothetical protein